MATTTSVEKVSSDISGPQVSPDELIDLAPWSPSYLLSMCTVLLQDLEGYTTLFTQESPNSQEGSFGAAVHASFSRMVSFLDAAQPILQDLQKESEYGERFIRPVVGNHCGDKPLKFPRRLNELNDVHDHLYRAECYCILLWQTAQKLNEAFNSDPGFLIGSSRPEAIARSVNEILSTIWKWMGTSYEEAPSETEIEDREAFLQNAKPESEIEATRIDVDREPNIEPPSHFDTTSFDVYPTSIVDPVSDLKTSFKPDFPPDIESKVDESPADATAALPPAIELFEVVLGRIESHRTRESDRTAADAHKFIQACVSELPEASYTSALLEISIRPAECVSTYFRDVTAAYTKNPAWRAHTLQQFLFDKAAGVQLVFAELRTEDLCLVSADTVTLWRKHATFLPFHNHGFDFPRHHAEDIFLIALRIAEVTGIAYDPARESEFLTQLVRDRGKETVADCETPACDTVLAVLVSNFDSALCRFMAELPDDQKRNIRIVSRYLQSIGMLKQALHSLGLVDSPRFARPREFKPHNEIPIGSAWSNATYDGNSRRATRNCFWCFINHAATELKLKVDWDTEELAWEEVLAARARGTLAEFLNTYNGTAVTPHLIASAAKLTNSFIEFARLKYPNPSQVLHATRSFYAWCGQEKLTDFEMPSAGSSTPSKLMGKVARVVAYLDQDLSSDEHAQSLLQEFTSRLRTLTTTSNSGETAIKAGKRERKLFEALVEKLDTKLQTLFSRSAQSDELRLEFMMRLQVTQLRAEADVRVLNGAIENLSELAPALKRRCLEVSGKRVRVRA